ncbi:sensor histidine kinase [Roseivirga thermotolerans]|nr:histidine kinase [Roseivirga thermotolerans]
MKKSIILKVLVLVAVVLFFAEKYFQLNALHGLEYQRRISQLINDDALIANQLLTFKIQKFSEYTVYLIIAYLSFKHIYQPLNKKIGWQASLPILVLISMVLGLIFSMIIKATNPYFSITPYNGQVAASEISMFSHLFLRQTVHSFFAVSLGLLIRNSLQYLNNEKGKLFRVLGSDFWVLLYTVQFLLILIINILVNVGETPSQIALMIPTSLLFALVTFTMSYLFLEAFSVNDQLSFKNFWSKISQCIIMTSGGAAIIYFSTELNLHFGDRYLNYTIPSFLIVSTVLFVLILSESLLQFSFYSKYIRKNQALRLELRHKDSSLSQLKSQINPHFLFNSLNSLYGLALEESSPKTSTGIQKLSEMMRFMLRENVEDTIEISREFEYVENYIELQKLRVDGNEKVRLEYEIDTACEGKITPMLIIPFIENAFKHGVSAHHNSWIEIKLSCSKEAIHLNVKNSNHKKLKSTEEESGIGLENVRQRLAMLYPGKHLFQLFENEESFEANLKIEVN